METFSYKVCKVKKSRQKIRQYILSSFAAYVCKAFANHRVQCLVVKPVAVNLSKKLQDKFDNETMCDQI